MKTCTKCNEEKPLNEFSRNPRKKDGLNFWCKTCYKQYFDDYYKNNKAIVRQRNKKSNDAITKRHREYIVEKLSAGCSNCSEKDIRALDFAHIDRTTKTEDVARLLAKRCSKIRLEKEINKCKVLCANCHRKETALENNSWKNLYM